LPPGSLARQLEIRREVRETGVLTNPLGRARVFLGRLWDEDTMKEALAQTQQGNPVVNVTQFAPPSGFTFASGVEGSPSACRTRR
jgi:hypothetical protein